MEPDSDKLSSTPSPDRPRKGRLIVISGPSGVGKSSVVDRLAAVRPLHFSVSVTTRPQRPGEKEGEDYYFVGDDEFRRRIQAGDFLEWAWYNQHRYGTPRRPVQDGLQAGRDVLLEIEVQGARSVRRSMPEALMIFIAPPSLAELEHRLRGRGDTSDADIRRRLDIARREMEAAEDLFDHVVVNDDLDGAVAEVAGILGSSEEIP